MRQHYSSSSSPAFAAFGGAMSAQQTFQPAQLAFAEIPFDSVPNFLKLPANLHLGEVAGVATNSKGLVYVYTRTGTTTATLGGSRVLVHGGSRLFQFDQNGAYVREMGVGIYGFLFAHVVRVDPQDNIWVVDEMANQIIKFDQAGKVLMVLGRKPEALNIANYEPPGPPAGAAGRGGAAGEGGGGRGGGAPAAPPPPQGVGIPGDTFNRPTDVAWDQQGNIFISDGYGNSRVAKYDKNGVYVKAWGSRGAGIGQFNTPHSIAVDAQGERLRRRSRQRPSRCSTTTGPTRPSSCMSARRGQSVTRDHISISHVQLERYRQLRQRRNRQDGAGWKSDRKEVRSAGKQLRQSSGPDSRDRLPPGQSDPRGELTNWRLRS
jgi:hypothetical protein